MKHSRQWLDDNPEVRAEVMAALLENGEARSSDFQRRDGQKGSWWNRKEQKRALEYLYNLGEVIIIGRHNFQRVYALREQALPDWTTRARPRTRKRWTC